ncbi:MAG TPA: PadR family transcriptional regulator [Candidatus Dormibacteraeota bacterium]|jgi:DNA-binding PadR family transcriptional regulator|nr:PadR family transcriptional regulator [Candidatus Dormibacteraeota bacterium]
MSLEHILLGLLREPASGYDLKAILDHGIGHFWAAELSQVYPTLKRLEKQKLLRSRRAASKRGPGRIVYELTAAGRKQLANWLRQEPQFGDMRHTFLAQIYLMDELSDLQHTLRFLEQLHTRWAARLEALKNAEKEWSRCDPEFPDDLSSAAFHQHLTLRMGMHAYQGWLTWCEESMRRVRTRMRKENHNGKPVSVAEVGAHRRGRARVDPILDTGNRSQGR